MPRVRFTVRRMMVAVAIVAVALAVSRLLSHRNRFLGVVAHHRWVVETMERHARVARSMDVRLTEESQRRWKWHSEILLKYEHAARYPWLPVAPDPPEPE